MLKYALTWRPRSDNMGHDLTVLAAMQHLPRIDHVLDAEALDAPLPGLAPDDRVVTLVTSHFLTRADHWPPHMAVAPACIGVHISQEDGWGVPIAALDGAGLAALRAAAPIAVRDGRTAKRLAALDVPHAVTGDITLTLRHADVPRRGIVCCDVPEEVLHAVRAFRQDVTAVTHDNPSPPPDFDRRMDAARALLDAYAGAEMVFTRRLHCAMACLALGTPVLWLYHPEYEDIGRFAPMDGMVRRQSVDDFLLETRQHGLPAPWRNPADIGRIQQEMAVVIHKALRRAEGMPLPLVPEDEASAWRTDRTRRMMDSAAKKIAQLENAHYEELHAKFERLAAEDSAKSTLTALLTLPQVRAALQEVSLQMQLDGLSPKDQKALRTQHRQGLADVDDLLRQGLDALSSLGWPD